MMRSSFFSLFPPPFFILATDVGEEKVVCMNLSSLFFGTAKKEICSEFKHSSSLLFLPSPLFFVSA